MRTRLSHNIGLKLFSLGLAFALWLVVAGEQRIEHALNVPLKLAQLPQKMALINDPAGFVTLKLRGPKSLVTALSPDEVDIHLELSRLKEGENLVAIRAEQVGLPRGVEVLQISPSRLRLVLEPVVEREVRVAARVAGTPAAGHYLKRTFVRPDRVKVVGPRSEVNRVARLYTSAVSLEGRSRDFAAKTPLEPIEKSIRLDGADSVQVVVEIRATGRH